MTSYYHVLFTISGSFKAFTLESRFGKELHRDIKAMASLVIDAWGELDGMEVEKDRYSLFQTKVISTEAEVLAYIKDPFKLDRETLEVVGTIKPEGAV